MIQSGKKTPVSIIGPVRIIEPVRIIGTVRIIGLVRIIGTKEQAGKSVPLIRSILIKLRRLSIRL